MRKWFIAFALLAACAATGRQSVAPDPGVPPFTAIPVLPPNTSTFTVNTGVVGPTQNLAKIGVDQTIQMDLTSTNGTGYWTAVASTAVGGTGAGVHTLRWPDDRTDQWSCFTPPPTGQNYPTTGICNAINPNPAWNANAYCNQLGHSNMDSHSGPNSTPTASLGFDGFMNQAIATLSTFFVTMSANYGSNYACSAGGDPLQAAAWAQECVNNYTLARCLSMTIGTEIYNCPTGHLCIDLHGGCILQNGQCPTQGNQSGSGGVYGQLFASYQNAIHSAAPGVKVLALARPQSASNNWDQYVLNGDSQGTGLGSTIPDGLEVEYYPNKSDTDTDTTVLYNYPFGFDDIVCSASCSTPTTASLIGLNVSRWHTQFGTTNIPTYVDQIALSASSPGLQSLNIPGAVSMAEQLFQAQLDPNIFALTWHTAQGKQCNYIGGSVPPNTPYVSPNFVFANNPPKGGLFGDASFASINNVNTCSNYIAPAGQLMIPGYMFQLASSFVASGEHMLGTSPANDQVSAVQLWAATRGTGHELAVVNRDTVSHPECIAISSEGSGTSVTYNQYGKVQADSSAEGPGLWTTPISGSIATWTSCIPITVPPWSLTVLNVP